MKKICTGCKKEKEANAGNFHRDRQAKDGYCCKCKECYKKKHSKEFCEKRKREERYIKRGIWKCKGCGKEKKLNEENFYASEGNKTGFQYTCKVCTSKEGRKKRMTSKEYRLWKKKKRMEKKGYKYCPKCEDFYEANADNFYRNKSMKDGLEGYCKKCKNDGEIDRRRNDPNFRLHKIFSESLRKSLQGNKNGKHWEDVVGYTLEELKQHLEGQFKEGMTWDNYGEWHIDHIIPKVLFEYTSYEDREFKQCWSLANLQPLWAEENIAKGDRILW